MAKANFRLASQRMNTGGGSGGGLRPVMVSAGAIGGLRSPFIPVSAATVRYTPMPIPQQVPDTTLDSAANFAQTWAKSAFEFEDREARADATMSNAGTSTRFIKDSLRGCRRNAIGPWKA